MANPTTIDELQLYFDLCNLSREERREILKDLENHLNRSADQPPAQGPEAANGTE